MNRQTLQLAWIGAFALAAIAATVSLVVLFTQRPTWLAPRNKYTVAFTDAPGVQPGTPVRRSGVRVGEVSSVALDDETGVVRLGLQLDPKFTPKANEEAVISQSLLTSDTTIDFLPTRPVEGKPADRTPLPPGTELRGRAAIDARELLNQASDVLPSAQLSLDQIRRSVEKFDKLSPRIEEAFREFAELSRAGREMIPELRQTNDRVRELLVTQVNPALPPGANAPQRAGLRSTSEKVAAAAEEMQAAARALTRTVERIDDIIVENRKNITRSIEAVANVLGPANQEAINKTVRNLAEITENARPASKRLDGLAERTDAAIARLGEAASSLDGMLTELRPATKSFGERGPSLVKNLDDAAARFSTMLGPLNDRIQPLLASLQESAGRLNRILADAGDLVQAVGRSDGTVAKLLSDPSLYDNIDAFAASLAKVGPRLDRILHDVEVFADKIARHPETIGVRGAIRPDSGLKEGAPPQDRPRLLPR